MAQQENWPTCEYRLTARAYIGRSPEKRHEMLEPGTIIVYDKMPGPHMEAIDDEGRAAKSRAREQNIDPFRHMGRFYKPEADDLLDAIVARLGLQPTPAAVTPKQPAAPPAATPPAPPPPPPPRQR